MKVRSHPVTVLPRSLRSLRHKDEIHANPLQIERVLDDEI